MKSFIALHRSIFAAHSSRSSIGSTAASVLRRSLHNELNVSSEKNIRYDDKKAAEAAKDANRARQTIGENDFGAPTGITAQEAAQRSKDARIGDNEAIINTTFDEAAHERAAASIDPFDSFNPSVKAAQQDRLKSEEYEQKGKMGEHGSSANQEYVDTPTKLGHRGAG